MITPDNYREYPALNMSLLKSVYKTKSLAHARAKPRVSSEALQFGTHFHTAILEPHKFKPIVRDWDLRSKAGKEKQEEAEATGRPILKQQDLDAMYAMRDSAMEIKPIPEILGSLDRATEKPLLYREPFYGEQCKSQIDLWGKDENGEGWLIDLKTTQDIIKFDRQIWDLAYDIQMAGYAMALSLNGYPVDHVAILAVEKAEPYGAQLVIMDGDALEIGQKRLKHALEIYRTLIESGQQSVAPVVRAFVPPWIMNNYLETEDF